MSHSYTEEQIDYIFFNITGRSSKDLTEMVNGQFNLDLKQSQIKDFKARYGLRSGLDSKFKPGNVPVNKGKRGGGWEPTQFKRGNMPHNWVPLGSERVTDDGYTQIKVQEGQFQKNWKGKHILTWEEKNGPVPKGHAVIFGDRDRRNFDAKNLILVSRRQLATLNRKGLIQNDADLTCTAVIMVDIYHKIGERRKLSIKKIKEGEGWKAHV